jgi:hypothetical protein
LACRHDIGIVRNDFGRFVFLSVDRGHLFHHNVIRLLISSFPADRLDEARNCARREVGIYFLFDQRDECFWALEAAAAAEADAAAGSDSLMIMTLKSSGAG